VTVLRPFEDLMCHVGRNVGETFEATEARAEDIARKLPGYIRFEATAENPAVDWSAMKVAELRAACAERGVEVPPKARKADLVAILEG
jgi:hypothetical protein